MGERAYTEPVADIVHGHSEILQRWVSKEEPEDVEDVVAVVGECVRVDDGVVVDGEQTDSNKRYSLKRVRTH